MKTVSYERQANGNFIPQRFTNDMNRLDFAGFKRAYGGASITEQPKGYAPPPSGFSLWKTQRGVVLAVRDES